MNLSDTLKQIQMTENVGQEKIQEAPKKDFEKGQIVIHKTLNAKITIMAAHANREYSAIENKTGRKIRVKEDDLKKLGE